MEGGAMVCTVSPRIPARQCVQLSSHITYFDHDIYIFVKIRAFLEGERGSKAAGVGMKEVMIEICDVGNCLGSERVQ